MSTTTEAWKPVVGYVGFYEVSDRGRVRSVDREVRRSDGRTSRLRGRVLRQATTRTGYMRVDLCRDSVRRPYEVHRLVAAAFIGPCPVGLQVMHENDEPSDNRAANLSYGTQFENMRQCVDRGRHAQTRKTQCDNGHPYEGENVLVRTGGGRRCRECRRDTQRRYVTKRRQQ